MVNTTEPWWDDSGSWIAATGGYEHYRRDKQGKRGGGIALCTTECFDYLELNNCNCEVEGIWVRIMGKANRTDILVGFCYRLHNHNEEADEIFSSWEKSHKH